MSVSQFMADQYANPTGWFGRFVIGPLLNRSNATANRLVFETLAPGTTDSVLEVGFGGGELLQKIAMHVAEGRVDGVELSDSMRAQFEAKLRRLQLSNVALHSGGIDSLPFADATFDCACTVNTIYFWPNLDRGLRELSRVIQRDGKLVIGFGSAEHLRRAGYEERGFTLYEPDDIGEAFARNGFETDVLSSIERGKRGPFFALRGTRV